MHRFVSRNTDRPVFSLSRSRARFLLRPVSSSSAPPPKRQHSVDSASSASTAAEPKRALSLAERDAALMAALEERSGDGGASGLELEDGKAPAMKRGVRENMFRVI